MGAKQPKIFGIFDSFGVLGRAILKNLEIVLFGGRGGTPYNPLQLLKPPENPSMIVVIRGFLRLFTSVL